MSLCSMARQGWFSQLLLQPVLLFFRASQGLVVQVQSRTLNWTSMRALSSLQQHALRQKRTLLNTIGTE